MNILALDNSLTATGYATNYLKGQASFGVLNPHKNLGKGMARLNWIATTVEGLAQSADVVVMEGYSYASKGRSILSIAELGGVIRWMIWVMGTPYTEVAPGTLKKFATGSGNAGKDEMLAASIRRLGYEGHDNNEADALWLLQMALHHYKQDGAISLPKAQLESLEKVQWPKL